MIKWVRLTGPVQRAYAKRLVDEAPDNHVVSIGDETRSQAQNRKLWPMLTDIQQQVEDMRMFSLDDMKKRFLNALGVEMRFLPTLENEGMFPVGLSSSVLTKTQFAGLIELLYAYGAKHGVRWSEPVNPDDFMAGRDE